MQYNRIERADNVGTTERVGDITESLNALTEVIKLVDATIGTLEKKCARVMRQEPVAKKDDTQKGLEAHSSVPLAQEIWSIRDELASQQTRLSIILNEIET